MITALSLLAAMQIDAASLMDLLVKLIIGALIFWLIWWFISWVGVPEPFLKVIKVILGLAVLIFLISILLGLSGTHIFR